MVHAFTAMHTHLHYMRHTVKLKYTDNLLSLAGLSNAVTVQAMNEIAQRMQLRHPNIATVMGVATEPVTEDPLTVYHCTQSSAVRAHHFLLFLNFVLSCVRDTAQTHEAFQSTTTWPVETCMQRSGKATVTAPCNLR